MRLQSDSNAPPALRPGQEGIALITTIMVMMLVSVLMVGFVSAIVADNRASGLDHDQTQAYAATHAGLEKLTSDLAALFTTDFSPSAAQLSTLTSSAPTVPGFTYVAPDGTPGYAITFNPDASGNPAPADPLGTTISAGPYQGFKGIITPYDITVTARSRGGAEVRMRRTLQTIAVPVFQFGMFSENDLSFFAGPNFNFGGRVHTNANLYLAEGNANTLTLADRVTAVDDVIRTHLSNGQATTTTGHTGTVNVLRAPNTFRALARTEGSLIGTVGTAQNEPLWTNLSVGTYVSNIRNGRTGARRLDLPLVSQGARPIDLIRRPRQGSNEDTANALVYAQRFFAQASLRILLSDTAADLTSLPTVTAGAPIPLSTLALATAAGYTGNVPLALSGGPAAVPAGAYTSPIATPLIDGFIKIEKQDNARVWTDVTAEILNLGFVARNLSNNTLNVIGNSCPAEPQPNAVIRLQRVRDIPVGSGATPANFRPCGVSVGVMSAEPTDYWPLALYDTREGIVRDGLATTSLNMALGGIMHYVELDVNNFRRWILGTIGVNGPTARNDNGYIVYFSDRRNNRNAAGAETGEYGFEDVVNPADANGLPNNLLDTGEDVGGVDVNGNPTSGNGVLDTYGGTPVNIPVGSLAPHVAGSTPLSTTVSMSVARANKPIFFRRALKIVNGQQGNIIAPGMAITSENPVYVQGNFNALPASTPADPHVASAVIADSVTMLSNNWNDLRSFISPNNPNGRPGTATGYRMAIIGGKPLSFPRPTVGTPPQDFGTDGGAHNFLRYIESWGGTALSYRGSIVSFYTSRQAVGTYKCCANVYGPPTRGYNFDAEFLIPSLLPPGTPMFRDVNTLTFRQLLRPTQ